MLPEALLNTLSDVDAVLAEPGGGVDGVRGVELEVQVWAGGVTAVADGGDLLAGDDVVTDIDQPGVDVPVPGDSAVVVVDVDDLAEAAGVVGSGGGDAAIGGCVDGGADGGGEVQAVVDTGREALGEAACGAGVGVGPGGAVRRRGCGSRGRGGCRGGGRCGSGSGLLGAIPPGA